MNLPCGCITGRFLCREGQRLHDEMMTTWRAARDLSPDDHRWAPYDEARDQFDKHMGNEPVGCTR